MTLATAALATETPVAVEPVKATLSTPGCPASAAPASRLSPVTTLKTPAARPASYSTSAKAAVEAGECSDGSVPGGLALRRRAYRCRSRGDVAAT